MSESCIEGGVCLTIDGSPTFLVSVVRVFALVGRGRPSFGGERFSLLYNLSIPDRSCKDKQTK